jgi:transcriptional regulator with XRE-family HTH domain
LSITFLNHFAQCTQIPANLLPVQKKRSRNPELRAFGEWLQDLRGEMSRERVSQRLADKGATLGGSTLAQYEKGTVWAPDVGVLLALSEIYGVKFELLARAVDENRKNVGIERDALVDLIRHDRDQPSDLSKGDHVDVGTPPAPPRLQQRYDDLLAAATDIAGRLVNALLKEGIEIPIPHDNAETRKGKSGSRVRDRKTG